MGTAIRTVGNLLVNGGGLNVVLLFAIAFLPIGVRFRNFDEERRADTAKIIHEMLAIVVGSALWLIGMVSDHYMWWIVLLIVFLVVLSANRREGILVRRIETKDGTLTRPGIITGALFDLATVASSVACALLMVTLLFQATSGLNHTSSVVLRYIASVDSDGDVVLSVIQHAGRNIASNFLFGVFALAFVFNLGRFLWEGRIENGWLLGVLGGILVHTAVIFALLVAFSGGWFLYSIGMAMSVGVYFLYTRDIPRSTTDWFEFADLQAQGHYLVAHIVVLCALGAGITTPQSYWLWMRAIFDQAQALAGR